MNHIDAWRYLENISCNNWNDLNQILEKLPRSNNFNKETHGHLSGAIMYLTYSLGVDGVSMEINKYIKIFNKVFDGHLKNCVVAGNIDPNAMVFTKENKIKIYIYSKIDGFERWGKPYYDLFYKKMEIGGKTYNSLPKQIWTQTLQIYKHLFFLVEKEDVKIMAGFNIASNPGNLSYTIAVILLSELLNIPVITFNYDFYWEDGGFVKGQKKDRMGTRDHFFTNLKIEEIYLLFKKIYPWCSTRWTYINANNEQTKKLAGLAGIDPLKITNISGLINTSVFHPYSYEEKKRVYNKLNLFFRCETSRRIKTIDIFDNTLKQYSQERKPIIISAPATKINFNINNTLLLLQPTRIAKRKQIEWDFLFIKRLFNQKSFISFISKTKKNILLLISGPVDKDKYSYFEEIYEKINLLYKSLNYTSTSRIFIGFKFGNDYIGSVKNQTPTSLLSHELYGIANFVLLPSLTEGIGLPIIEGAASGNFLLINKFIPINTFHEITRGLYFFNYVGQTHRITNIKELVDALIHPKTPYFSHKLKINRKIIENKHGLHSAEIKILKIVNAIL